MRSRDAAAAVVAAAALAFALLAIWATFARSGIPREWHGTVTKVEARHEKHPGVDDAWFVTVDGETMHVDAWLAQSLDEGDRVDKDGWRRDLVVNGRRHERLALSRDAQRMLVFAPLLAVAAAVVTVRRGYPGAS